MAEKLPINWKDAPKEIARKACNYAGACLLFDLLGVGGGVVVATQGVAGCGVRAVIICKAPFDACRQ